MDTPSLGTEPSEAAARAGDSPNAHRNLPARRATLVRLERAIAVRERELSQLKVLLKCVVRGHALSADGHAFVSRVLADEGT